MCLSALASYTWCCRAEKSPSYVMSVLLSLCGLPLRLLFLACLTLLDLQESVKGFKERKCCDLACKIQQKVAKHPGPSQKLLSEGMVGG